MEDFEKMKKEESEVQNNNYEEAENKKKGSKNKKALKISIAAVSAVVLVGTGVFIGSRFLGNNTMIDNSSAQNSTMTTNNPASDKKESEANVQQGLVTDGFTYTGTLKDESTISFKVPKININSSDVIKINNEIDEKVTSEAKKAVSAINDGGIWLYNIFYNYYINDNILSVVIEMDFDSDVKGFYVYNINTITGTKVTNEEILKIKKMTNTQFSEKLSSAAKIKFTNTYGNKDTYMNDLKYSESYTEATLKEQEEFYVTQYNQTISESNCKIDNNKIYLGDNQNLNVVTKIYSLAGADAYDHILNLDDEKTFIGINKNTQFREELTKEEISDLTDYLNKTENNSFILMDYSGAMDLIKNQKYQKHKEVLKYSIAGSKYVKNATAEQCLKLYNLDSINMIHGDTYLINENDLVSFLKDKLGVTFEKDFIKQVFNEYYNQDFQMYYFSMSDSAFTKTSIQSSYKIADIYYLKLNHGQTVAMQKNGNSNYLFCSCTGYDGSIGF